MIELIARVHPRQIQSAPTGPDKLLAVLTLILVIFGILMVYNVSILEAYDQGYQDKYHFLKMQSLWAGLGLILAVWVMQINARKLRAFAVYLLLLTLFIQVMALIPSFGVEAHGAQRWLKIGSVQIQPSEFAKLAFVIYLAAWLSSVQKLSHFLFLTGILTGLVFLGRDLGTAMVIFLTGMGMYYISGAPLWHLVAITPLAGLALAAAIVIAPYRLSRVLAFINPLRDPLGSSYHIVQILLALGSGSWFGLGLGQSRQKYKFVPAASTDSIFAIIGEELGFIGAMSLVLVYLTIIWRGFRIAQEQKDRFLSLLAYGITLWLGIQIFINLGAMVALLPLTGVPLPFISRGGSSLIVSLIGIGLLLNLSLHRR